MPPKALACTVQCRQPTDPSGAQRLSEVDPDWQDEQLSDEYPPDDDRARRALHNAAATVAAWPEAAKDLFHLVDEAVEVPQRRLVRLITKPRAKLVVVVVLNARRGEVAVAGLQVLVGRSQLEDLIAGARRAGLETTFTVTGEPVPLPAAVDLAAYRIVQESLTNAIRHAGPATAAVWLGYHHDELRIDVTDTGRGQPAGAAASHNGSHGLAGMRERAAAVGGTVETGPGPCGGFRVAARLPFGGQLADPARVRDVEGARP